MNLRGLLDEAPFIDFAIVDEGSCRNNLSTLIIDCCSFEMNWDIPVLPISLMPLQYPSKLQVPRHHFLCF
jgi:hypothetical protein